MNMKNPPIKTAIVLYILITSLCTSASAIVYPPLPPGSIEIAYDDGIFNNYGVVVNYIQEVRVKFTPLPGTVGGVLKEARIAWFGYYEGQFYVTIRDAITGKSVSSYPQFNIPGEWQTVDVSTLGFEIPDHDFYIEVHHVSGSTLMAVFFDENNPDSMTSEYTHDHGNIWSVWNGSNIGLRAVIQPQMAIPEFPTIIMPIAAIIGLMFLFQRGYI
jgi:hypothetical protein